MLDFRVHTFLTVCKHMNYTKAAEELCITQPAVSQQIKYLEKEYDTVFFNYKGKILSLTESGKRFLKIARAFTNDEKLFKRRLAAFEKENKTTQVFNFGVTYTVAEYTMKDLLPFFLKENPDIKLNMKVENTSNLIKDFYDGSIDFALVEGHFPKTAFESRVFSRESFVPVCSKNHVFKNEPNIISDLLEEDLLIREPGSGTREIFEDALAIRNLALSDFKEQMLISNMTAIVELVRQDCGISFLYERAVKEHLNTGEIKLIPINDFNLQHDFSFIWNIESVYGPVFEEVYNKMLQIEKKYNMNNEIFGRIYEK